MSSVHEVSGAQVLPPVSDPKATLTGWAAHLATDADLRTTHHHWAHLAQKLEIRP